MITLPNPPCAVTFAFQGVVNSAEPSTQSNEKRQPTPVPVVENPTRKTPALLATALTGVRSTKSGKAPPRPPVTLTTISPATSDHWVRSWPEPSVSTTIPVFAPRCAITASAETSTSEDCARVWTVAPAGTSVPSARGSGRVFPGSVIVQTPVTRATTMGWWSGAAVCAPGVPEARKNNQRSQSGVRRFNGTARSEIRSTGLCSNEVDHKLRGWSRTNSPRQRKSAGFYGDGLSSIASRSKGKECRVGIIPMRCSRESAVSRVWSAPSLTTHVGATTTHRERARVQGFAAGAARSRAASAGISMATPPYRR